MGGESSEQLSNEKTYWLFRVSRGIILTSSVGIIMNHMNHYEDPYLTTTSMSWKISRDIFLWLNWGFEFEVNHFGSESLPLLFGMNFVIFSLRLTAKIIENRLGPKRKRSFLNHLFSGVKSLLVSRMVIAG